MVFHGLDKAKSALLHDGACGRDKVIRPGKKNSVGASALHMHARIAAYMYAEHVRVLTPIEMKIDCAAYHDLTISFPCRGVCKPAFGVIIDKHFMLKNGSSELRAMIRCITVHNRATHYLAPAP